MRDHAYETGVFVSVKRSAVVAARGVIEIMPTIQARLMSLLFLFVLLVVSRKSLELRCPLGQLEQPITRVLKITPPHWSAYRLLTSEHRYFEFTSAPVSGHLGCYPVMGTGHSGLDQIHSPSSTTNNH